MDTGTRRNMTAGVIPFIFSDRTYLPIRYIVEPLGFTFRIDTARNAIIIE
ncbi:MAG: copper amine oxidase N-terminal domain-containing protein [Turicibacter sp.]|nr:copper amine oxidase N-terminal domain-containing protein [Turicibacter sp.]